jgi:chromosome segregation ATPase
MAASATRPTSVPLLSPDNPRSSTLAENVLGAPPDARQNQSSASEGARAMTTQPPADLSVEILKQIRGEIQNTNAELRQTNARLDQTNERLDQTNERLEEMREELSRRIVASEIRTATAIAELAMTVRDMTTVLREQHDLRPRVERCEIDIAELKRRVS